jgi:hypothetical protein
MDFILGKYLTGQAEFAEDFFWVTLILVALFAIHGLVFFDVILDFTELFFQFFGCRQFSLIFLGQSFRYFVLGYTYRMPGSL